MVHHPKDLFFALVMATAILLFAGLVMYMYEHPLFREAVAYGCLLFALTVGWFIHFHDDITQ